MTGTHLEFNFKKFSGPCDTTVGAEISRARKPWSAHCELNTGVLEVESAKFTVCNSRLSPFLIHGFCGIIRPLMHGLCAFFQAALDTCLDSPLLCQPLSSRFALQGLRVLEKCCRVILFRARRLYRWWGFWLEFKGESVSVMRDVLRIFPQICLSNWFFWQHHSVSVTERDCPQKKKSVCNHFGHYPWGRLDYICNSKTNTSASVSIKFWRLIWKRFKSVSVISAVQV